MEVTAMVYTSEHLYLIQTCRLEMGINVDKTRINIDGVGVRW